jgi:tRNA/rRNA methyltransferase
MIVAFFDYFEGKLEESGFFRPPSKRPSMQRNLRNMFHRMELTQQDVRTLWGAVVRLAEGPRLEAKTRKRVKAVRKPKKGTADVAETSEPD